MSHDRGCFKCYRDRHEYDECNRTDCVKKPPQTDAKMTEAVAKENDRLTEEIERLTKKCDMQAMILRRLTPENHPDTLFIHGTLGEKDDNGMPKKLLVVPAYGVDFSYVYEYNGKVSGPEW